MELGGDFFFILGPLLPLVELSPSHGVTTTPLELEEELGLELDPSFGALGGWS